MSYPSSIIKVYIEHHDTSSLPHIVFFAERDIAEGEDLTFPHDPLVCMDHSLKQSVLGNRDWPFVVIDV